ncbi:MAG TPA: CBS domain-containing protein [Saprospiraceae bacterium]|nr:CBS domain-containing protein [Saprospiraceae bacterium]HPN70206.1 CBS domain-containing protein [Saprospiraceae bacterium]
MNLLASVADIMTKNPVTISPDETLTVASEIFDKYNIHHIPVVFEGDLVGMLSKSDFSLFTTKFSDASFTHVLLDVNLQNYKVKSIMTTALAKLEAYQRINAVLDIFKDNHFHALPVVEGKRVIGIVTTMDIIKHLAQDNEAINSYK